jgi:hypothetical protein
MLRLNKHPYVPDNIVVLDPQESIAGYQAAYGDQIARWYEQDKVILFPSFPVPADLDYLAQVSLPEDFKKIGLVSGICQPLVSCWSAETKDFVIKNRLFETGLPPVEVIYLHQQICQIFQHLMDHVPKLFPRYRFMENAGNITFRFCPTRDEGMHIDSFPGTSRIHRVKLFVNFDTEPRQWRVSCSSFDLIQRLRRQLPDPLPDNMNEVNRLLNGLIAEVPAHEVHFPRLSCVLANGETVAHQVVYGNRMVAFEWRVDPETMIDKDLLAGHRLALLREAEAARVSN